MSKDKNNICFDYETVLGLPHSIGAPIFQDLRNHFSHAKGAFVPNDPDGRNTAYNLGQQSVINYIIARLNEAKRGSN